MKNISLTALLLTGLFSVPALANECIQTCEQEYSDCKAVAESKTAKQGCEDDVQQCKEECK